MLQNEIPKYLYIIAAGEVEMSYTCPYGYSVIIGTCAKGDVCGDIGVLLHRLQPFEFRTRTSCTLLRLDAKTFLDIVRDFVEDPSIILSNLLKHLKDQDLMKEYLTVTDDEGKLRRGRMKRPLPLSLHNIISRDDDSLLYQLLAWGFDPNESNKNGETALHIAASTGSVPCVVLLLKYRANPYIRDNRGLKRLVPRNTRRH
ncbi:hypothetical protein RIF29_18148 [Crotalaria pallida]|uniref:Potassium channel n=1 Tax=Crotalaria pallida TaxID=3830 RepID=A0AAN9IFZ0_CROPI